MVSIKTTVKAQIWGDRNSWNLSPCRNQDEPSIDADVELEIQGDEQNGYHLVMSPSGFFTADTWHQTKQDALDAAAELFGVEPNSWSPQAR